MPQVPGDMRKDLGVGGGRGIRPASIPPAIEQELDELLKELSTGASDATARSEQTNDRQLILTATRLCKEYNATLEAEEHRIHEFNKSVYNRVENGELPAAMAKKAIIRPPRRARTGFTLSWAHQFRGRQEWRTYAKNTSGSYLPMAHPKMIAARAQFAKMMEEGCLN